MALEEHFDFLVVAHPGAAQHDPAPELGVLDPIPWLELGARICGPGGLGRVALPIQRALERAQKLQPFLGPGDADVKQPALFGHVLERLEGAAVREDAILQPGDEDRFVFEALGRVQGHQRRRIGALLHVVGLAHQRDVGQKVLERRFADPGRHAAALR